MIVEMLQEPQLELRYVAELHETVGTELRLLHQLHDQLMQQRDAVARGEADAINDTVHAAGRVLHTLEEARRRRRKLCDVLLSDPETLPAQIPEALGLGPGAPLHSAVGELLDYAEVVARCIAVNRRLLAGAVRTGQDLIHVLQGEPRGGLVYERETVLPARGALLNRSI